MSSPLIQGKINKLYYPYGKLFIVFFQVALHNVRRETNVTLLYTTKPCQRSCNFHSYLHNLVQSYQNPSKKIGLSN